MRGDEIWDRGIPGVVGFDGRSGVVYLRRGAGIFCGEMRGLGLGLGLGIPTVFVHGALAVRYVNARKCVLKARGEGVIYAVCGDLGVGS